MTSEKKYKGFVILQRIRSHMALVNFFMILYLTVAVSAFYGLLLAAGIVSAMVVIGILDWKYYWEKENKYRSTKDPVIMEMLGRIKEIQKTVKEIRNEKG